MPRLLPLRWEGLLGKLRRRPWLGLTVVAVCLLVVAVAVGVVGVQVWARHHWGQARRASAENDWTAARRHLDSCLAVWPNDGEVHLLAARVSRRGGDLDAARFHLNRAEEQGGPQDAVDLEHLLLKVETAAGGQVESALQAYLRARHPDGPLILEALVRGRLSFNRLKDAYHYAELWVRTHPDDWQAYLHRGMVLQRFILTHAPYALRDYERAVELKPSQPEPRLRLGQMLEFTGRYAEATPHFEVFRERHPDQIEGVIGVVGCLLSQGEADRAGRILDDWSTRNEHTAQTRFLKGRIALERDDAHEAVAWFQQAEKELGPSRVEFHHNAALAYRRLGRSADAERHEQLKREIDNDLRRVQEITKAVSDDDQNLELRAEAATILARRGEPEDAARWAVSILQLDPKHAFARKLLADLGRKPREGERLPK